jgi:glycosyltransferase involved in cell wall biosynthesis
LCVTSGKGKGTFDYVKYLRQSNLFKNNVYFLMVAKNEDKNKDPGIRYEFNVVDRNLLAKYYCSADIFLFPSTVDNFPLVILEALACGLPVLSFDVGGVKEIVEHERNGYIAKYKSKDDLEKGFTRLLRLSDEKRSIISQENSIKAEELFSQELMVDRYIKLYRSLL